MRNRQTFQIEEREIRVQLFEIEELFLKDSFFQSNRSLFSKNSISNNHSPILNKHFLISNNRSWISDNRSLISNVLAIAHFSSIFQCKYPFNEHHHVSRSSLMSFKKRNYERGLLSSVVGVIIVNMFYTGKWLTMFIFVHLYHHVSAINALRPHSFDCGASL